MRWINPSAAEIRVLETQCWIDYLRRRDPDPLPDDAPGAEHVARARELLIAAEYRAQHAMGATR